MLCLGPVAQPCERMATEKQTTETKEVTKWRRLVCVFAPQWRGGGVYFGGQISKFSKDA